MREIKFRGKRLDNGEWQIGDLITEIDADLKVVKAFIHIRLSNVEYNQNALNSMIVIYEVDYETVGQYTNLKDKNGKEIYEGNVIKQEYTAIIKTDYDPVSYGLIDQETEEGHHIGEVVIIASKGVCMRKPLRYSLEDDKTEISNQYKNVAGYRCEVIGNVYDNQDLIKKAD